MAATYGYGGEFSSDEDIDRMEQQAERLAQSKFDSFAQVKPTKHQIEEAIETIRSMPIEQDVSISDDLLAALLDHYKTARGPIVDSTRNLYKKIILRLVRGDQPAHVTANGDQVNDSNGGGVTNNTNGNINNNNNRINIYAKGKHSMNADVVNSSDDDEPMPPVTSQTGSVERSNLDSRPVVSNINDKAEPMEVDSEISVKPAYRTSTEDDDDDEFEEDDDEDSDKTESSATYDEDDDDESSDSEVLDVTPVKKAPAQQTTKSVQKPSESVKRQTVKKQSEVNPQQKKPYTRSQRVAATRATSAVKAKKTDVSSSKVDGLTQTYSVTSVTKSSDNSRISGLTKKLQPKILIPSFAIAFFGFLLLYFKSDLTKIIDRLLPNSNKF